MIQMVQSIEAAAATATGDEQVSLLAAASTMREDAMKAISTMTMTGSMAGVQGAGAAPTVGANVWGVVGVGMGLWLL